VLLTWAVRCVAVRCAALRCAAVRCGAAKGRCRPRRECAGALRFSRQTELWEIRPESIYYEASLKREIRTGKRSAFGAELIMPLKYRNRKGDVTQALHFAPYEKWVVEPNFVVDIESNVNLMDLSHECD